MRDYIAVQREGKGFRGAPPPQPQNVPCAGGGNAHSHSVRRGTKKLDVNRDYVRSSTMVAPLPPSFWEAADTVAT